MSEYQPSLKDASSPDDSAGSLHPSKSHRSSKLPQIISHRGYKGKYPENTISAIEGAVLAGTHALELDLHLTKDGVVVLSHDPTLERCYGVKKKVGDCDWDYLKTLRTTMAPHAPMPRLLDVLEYVRKPGREHLWLLLDIKLTNDPETLLRRISETIDCVPKASNGPEWHQRIVLGCWSARYLAPRAQYLPRYEMALIGAHMSYARQFLQVPRISFNINQCILMGPLGRGFLQEAFAAQRKVYLWTVNEPNLMRWGIRHGVDGIITDDPALYRQVCEEWEKEQKDGTSDSNLDRLTVGQRIRVTMVTLFVMAFGWFWRRKYLPPLDFSQMEERKTN